MRGIGFGLERLGLAALAWPRLAVLFLVVATATSLFGMTRLTFDDDVVRSFRSASPSYQDFLALERERGEVLYNIAVIASRDTPLTANDLRSLREFHFDLEFIEGVDAVLSLFGLRDTGPGLEAGKAVVPDDFSDADIAAMYARAEGNHAWPGRTVSADRRALMFVVIDDGTRRTRAERRALLDDIHAATQAVAIPGLTLSVIGSDIIRFEIADSIKRDIVLFSAGGCAISFLLAFWWFRNWRLATLSFLPALLSVTWMLGFSSLAGMPMSVTTDVVPVLLIVMSFSDGMHLVHALRGEKVENRAELVTALGRIVARIGPACALTSLTTALSLLSFVVSGYGALVDLALFGGVGTMVSFVAVITSLPTVGRYLLRPADLGFPDDENTFGHRASRAMTRFVPRHPRLIVAAGVALLVIGFAGQMTTRADIDTYEFIPERSPTLAASIDAENRFGGVFTLWARIEARTGENFSDAEEWRRLQSIHEALENAARPAPVFSPVTMARAAGHAASPPTKAEKERIPDWFSRRFGEADSGVVYLGVFVGDPNRAAQNRAQYDAIEAAATAAGARFSGTPALIRHDGLRLIDRMGLSLLAASVAAIALIVLAFRNPWLATAIGLANVTPDLLTGAALHVLEGGRMTMAGGMSMTIAFGIAIDDTIHVLNRIQHQIHIGKPRREAVIGTIGDMSPLLGATTIILVGGLALTLMSDFATVRSFGVLTMLILAFAVFGDLLILPAVLLLDKKWSRR